MRVAIVDDEKKERDNLRGFLQRFSEEFQKSINVDEYHSSDELLSDYKTVYDVIIFDIDMPGTNGMDAARIIREIDKNVVILFITNIAQYAINGYEVEAVDYVIKPIEYYDFSMKFQKVARKVAQRQENYVILDTLDGTKKVSVADIYYVEVLAHYLIYHTSVGDYKIRGSMKVHEESLTTYNFVRIHKSYLVNLANVENLHANEVKAGGTSLPIGRVYKERLLQEYLRYARG